MYCFLIKIYQLCMMHIITNIAKKNWLKLGHNIEYWNIVLYMNKKSLNKVIFLFQFNLQIYWLKCKINYVNLRSRFNKKYFSLFFVKINWFWSVQRSRYATILFNQFICNLDICNIFNFHANYYSYHSDISGFG